MRDEGVESRKVIEQIRESRRILPSSRRPQWQEMGSLKLFVLSISCSPGRTSRLAHQAIYGQIMEGPICRVSKDSPSGMDSFTFDMTGKTRHRRSGTYTPYNVSNPPGSYSPLETSNPDHASAAMSEQAEEPLTAVVTDDFMCILRIFNIFLDWPELEGFSYQGPAKAKTTFSNGDNQFACDL